MMGDEGIYPYPEKKKTAEELAKLEAEKVEARAAAAFGMTPIEYVRWENSQLRVEIASLREQVQILREDLAGEDL